MIDWNKPIQTRDGRPATILYTRGRGDRPVTVLVTNQTSDATAYDWAHNVRKDGMYTNRESALDIINVPEPIKPTPPCVPDETLKVLGALFTKAQLLEAGWATYAHLMDSKVILQDERRNDLRILYYAFQNAARIHPQP